MMNIQIPLYILICLLGVIIGLQLQGSPENKNPSPSPSSGSASAAVAYYPSNDSDSQNAANIGAQLQNHKTMLESLELRLSKESQKRDKLEKQLQTLLARTNAAAPSNPPDNGDSAQTASPRGSVSNNDNWFNEQALVAVGFTNDKASYLRQKFEEREMKRLYLRDQAAREGWLNSDRYRQARRELSDSANSLRQELSEQDYDAYLYAAGRPNRVLVSSTMQSSPAGKAGIHAGDTILRYGDSRIYNWRDLRQATSEGQAGDMVMVTLLRNGVQQQVYVPRGPLGVKLDTDSVAPGS